LGGDEFVLVIDNIPSVGDARSIGERVHAALAQPLRAGGHSISMAASVGICVANGNREMSADDVLRFADVAMYRAKHAGRNQTAVYLPYVPSIRQDHHNRDQRRPHDDAQSVRPIAQLAD
jgi:diguanylate cyclase (GGDEF)-like protein